MACSCFHSHSHLSLNEGLSVNRTTQEEIIGRSLQNPDAIVAAFLAVGGDLDCGFTLPAVCATVEDESGGRNIFGGDPWNPDMYPKGAALPIGWHEQPVTRWRYRAYRAGVRKGLQPNGVGPGQLTSPSLQVEADNIGGCWKPEPNLIVAFHYLKQLFQVTGSSRAGYARYNGSGPAAQEYGLRLEGYKAEWTARLT